MAATQKYKSCDIDLHLIATTRTGPFGKELTNQNVTWAQSIAMFFSQIN